MATPREFAQFTNKLAESAFKLLLAFTTIFILACAGNSAHAATLTVPAGGDLQATLNAAQPGDTILLDAGATYRGPFTLPVKAGAAWITIRGNAPDSQLPATGERITPAYAHLLPKLIAPGGGQPALRTSPGAHHFRFLGVEFAKATPDALVYELVRLGEGDESQTSLSSVPHNLEFDRCYLHGEANGQLKRGIALNSASTTVVNSYISEVKGSDFESQALCGWNGPGPFKVVNNYLEAASENIMFGGADPNIAQLVPADIEIRGNHLRKPVEWRGKSVRVKNLLELKNARRVVIDGNLLENCWADAQRGTAVVLTPRNQGGGAPWSVVEEVKFTNNVVRHAGAGMTILGTDDMEASGRLRRVEVRNNLFDDISTANWGGAGFGFLISGVGASEISLVNNTLVNNWEGLRFEDGTRATGLKVANNILHRHIIAGGAVGVEGLTQVAGAGGWSVTRNVIVENNLAELYPSNNLVARGYEQVGFVDRAGGNLRLAASSPYRNAGTDGRDIGVDFSALAPAFKAANGFAARPAAVVVPSPQVRPRRVNQ
jgi:hypothetical protein